LAQFVKVAIQGEIADGHGKVVEVGGCKIALFRSGGRFYAIDNACRHEGGSLGEGEIYGTRVICPLHGWEYDFAAGHNVDDPELKIACFAVRLEGDDVLVEI
jgi:nitrite reductase/ring-hydroxylating ferredoxin subunit